MGVGHVSDLPEMPILSFQRMEPTLLHVAQFPAASGDSCIDKYDNDILNKSLPIYSLMLPNQLSWISAEKCLLIVW